MCVYIYIYIYIYIARKRHNGVAYQTGVTFARSHAFSQGLHGSKWTMFSECRPSGHDSINKQNMCLESPASD